MTNNKYNLVCIGSVFLASFIAGWTIMFAVNIHNKYSALQETKDVSSVTRFSRAIIVKSVDRDNRTLIANTFRGRGIYDRIQVLVPKEAKIERQTPLIENGVIIGFSSPIPASFEELAPDVRGFISVNVDKDGQFVAQSILIGDPFPRP